MLLARNAARGLTRIASVVFFVWFGSAGCRIQSKEPYWIETHGHALGNRVVGWDFGALLLGGDRQLWAYPGPWANPWVAKGQSRPLRAIAAQNTAVYGLLSDGTVARFSGSSWAPQEGSANWNVTELSVSDDEHLAVISDGKLRAVSHNELRPLSCDAQPGLVAVAGVRKDEAFVLDGAGNLYFNGGGACDKIPAPASLQRIAARADRLLAVATDGSVWRRRNNAWAKLPPPRKFRQGHAPVVSQPQDVGISAYSTWLVDTEGSVFLLSDES